MAARRRTLQGVPPPAQNDVAAPVVATAPAPVPVPVEVSAEPPHFRKKSETGDVLVLYEDFCGSRKGPITIYVRRVTGTPAQTVIETQPVLGSGLYRELQQFHGRHQEAEYEVSFRAGKEPLGFGFITMPASEPQQQGQAMPSSPWPPQQPSPTQQQAAAPAGMPPAQPPPGMIYVPGFGYAPVEKLFQVLTGSAPVQSVQPAPAPVPAPQPQPDPTMPPVQPPAGMFHVPGFGYVPAEKLFQALSGIPAPAVQPPPPPPPQPAEPSVQAPPGMLYVPGFGYAPVEKLFQVLTGGPSPAPAPTVQQPPPAQQQPQVQTPPGMVRTDIGFISAEALLRAIADDRRPSGPPGGYRVPPGPRSSYYDRAGVGEAPPGDPQQPAYARPMYGQQPQPVQPVQREKTPMEVMRDALGLSRAIVDMADQIRPPAAPAAPPEPEPPGDDSPVRVVDVGPAKMIINSDDGSTRVWESLIANAPSAFKFMGEQLDAIRKTNLEREARKQQAPQLPPGYVEVGPGYVPPEGFVAVPVGQVPHRAAPQPQPVVMQPQVMQPQPVYAAPVPMQAVPVQAAPAPVQAAQVVLPDPPAQMPVPIEEQPPQPWQPTFNPGGGQ